MAKTVTAIPATKQLHQAATRPGQNARKKVAAYARVSTDSEEQASSYEAQINHYTTYIQSRNEWIFAGLYADEGISGTTTKHREGFQTMIGDALAGKIDLILTKSVSRFARNTVDSLTTVRQLKDAGVEVYFEKENIYTFDSKGELLITIMSSLAQEESRSISENVTWGHRKRFAEGKALIPYKALLGYTKNEEGTIIIDEDEAPIVRRIYAEFLAGRTPSQIAADLTQDAIPTPMGKKNWTLSTVNSILRNEKYKGDALLQKTFTIDFLTKTVKKNEGEVPQYYVTGHHEAIIDPAIWQRVQIELNQRCGRYISRTHIFTSMIRCSDCGGTFGRKTWHAGTKHEQRIWRCNNKYGQGKTPCGTPHVTDNQIQQAFIDALSRRVTGNTGARKALTILETTVFDTSELKTKRDQAAQEIDEITVLIDQLVATAATTTVDIDQYDTRYAELETRHNKATRKHAELETKITDRQTQHAQARTIADYLDIQPPLEYNDDTWSLLVDHAKIATDGTIQVVFKDQVPTS